MKGFDAEVGLWSHVEGSRTHPIENMEVSSTLATTLLLRIEY